MTNPMPMNYRHLQLSLTPRRKAINKKVREESGMIIFDPTITTHNDVSECFRIFINPQRISKQPAQCLQYADTDERHPKITVYIDGACTWNRKDNAQCGVGIWFSPDNPNNRAFKVLGSSQSKHIGKITTIILAAQATPHFYLLEIRLDSKYTIEGLTTHLHRWEN